MTYLYTPHGHLVFFFFSEVRVGGGHSITLATYPRFVTAKV